MARHEAYYEAQQKIAEALRKDSTELDLNGIGLTELPSGIWKIKNLKVLKLGYEYKGEKNQLKEIPKEIGQLTQLTSLNLSYNQLTALPDSLGQLTQLTSLNLSDNRLTTLPDSLSQLTQLTSLNLSDNRLTTLPDSLSQLRLLTEFSFSRNLINALPTFLSQFVYLKRLEFCDNRLIALPEWISQLENLMELDVSNNNLTKLPEALRQVAHLSKLDIHGNQLTELPNWISQLNNLIELNISNNKLSVLPESLGQLEHLQSVDISKNQLLMLPESFGNLKNLIEIFLESNNLTELPNSIKNLTALKILCIAENKFSVFPESICSLKGLRSLGATGNKINEIPNEIENLKELSYLLLGGGQFIIIPPKLEHKSYKKFFSYGIPEEYATKLGPRNNINKLPASLINLKHLEKIELGGNPLNPALQSAYDACGKELFKSNNYEPLFAYLRSLEQSAEPLYEAKLVLVGEGDVGKTTLLKALKGKQGEAPQEHEPTTHGVEIDIHGLRLPHPAQDGVKIQLNAWDFGGQDVYRVTHQFFFSKRSLYLLVWEPRRGVQQCQVEDWLNMIRLRVGDEARVIIISTYSTSGEHIARIDKPVLKQQYGDMIVGFHEVDSLVPDPATGEMRGIAELKRVIASEASKLEQMGMLFNNDWKAARDELLALPEPRISYTAFAESCAKHKLSQIDTETLAHLMHDLGYIVHYADDEKLREDVVLKPQWLTKAIGFVLENRATVEREGILPDGELYQVWHDHAFPKEPRYDPALYPFFLRLMEKYDVSYRLPEDRHASLVAQHVPQVRPELPWLPDQIPSPSQRRIAMICAMEEDPPGLVPWMIVRTHDYAVEQNHHRLHWQKGIFLDHGAHGQAMLEKRDRDFHIYAQGDWPEYFMNVLQNTLQKLIDDNWPGLKDRYRFMVPCSETVNGQPCKGKFNIHALRQWLAEGDTSARCQECSKRQSIAKLLLGFEERPMDVQLREINERLAGMDSRIANYFMALMRAIADEGKNGPRLFTFQQGDFSLSPFSRPVELQLWCEAEGCQHPVYESGMGCYPIRQSREWLVKIAPYAEFALNVLRVVTPAIVPAIDSIKGADTAKNLKIKDQLDLSKAITDKLTKDVTLSGMFAHGMERGGLITEPERAGILALHALLHELDPSQSKLGLYRVSTYTGDYRWLCEKHYDAYQSNIPDTITGK